jgi:mono/diheme cytochrome c family protein
VAASLTGFALVLIWACLTAHVRAAQTAGQTAGQSPEGNPFRGRQLFQDKSCSGCHAVWGHGGSLGPEITVAVAGKRWDELVGAFWNHTPQMMDEVSRKGYAWPTLDEAQMADILSYLYYLRLFDEPGDPVRGADTYARLQCAACHTLAGRGESPVGGALDRFGAFPSPAPLAQAMWNSGPVMQEEQLRLGRSIPQFTGHEMADLQAYIRAEGRRSGREVELLPVPNPARGVEVYRAKRCGVCHDGRGEAPDIGRSVLSRTASEITGLLWNHSYAMGSAMADRGVPFPAFDGSELADLIAHLYFRGYIGADGDPKRGATVFRDKGCATCHKEGGDAPDLSAFLAGSGRAELASAMWNHAPQMHDLMAEKAPFWPKFESDDMRHLVAYLRNLARRPAP